MNDTSFISRVTAAIFFLFAGYECYDGISMTWQGLQSLHWTQKQGMVLEANPVQSPSLASGRSGGSGILLWFPKIHYNYTVNNQPYSGTRIQFGIQFAKNSILNNYPVNQPVTVFYQPTNPGNAVLKRGPFWLGIGFSLGLALFFFFAGQLFLIADPFY